VDYSYKSSDKSVTLSKDGNKLEMTIGSKIAYLNGKKLTLSQGPILAKNYDNGYSYVLVPGSATATYLGYNYSWNKNNNTSSITTKKQEDDTNNSNTEPELGDDGVVLDPGTVLNQWQSDPVISGMSTGIHELNTTIPSTQTGIIYSVARDYNNTKLNTETFVITADTPFEKVISGISNQVITIQAANKMCTDQLYQLYGVSSNYVNTIGTNYNTTDLSSIITLNVVPQYVTYDLSLSEDKKSLYVTVYLNNLSTAVVGTNSMGDYLRMIGTDIKNMVITKQDKYMYLDFPYTTNALGNLNTNITGAKYLKYMYTINSADNTRIILELNDGYEYYISEEGNQGTISFITPGSTQQPETPSENDFSNYEIVIPKPDGISDNMITHADYYHYNKFSIKIPGDHTTYFASHPVVENSDVITNVSVSLNSNNETEIKFTTSRLQGYEFDTDSKYIYVHIGEPRDIYKNIVVLDPGHGGPSNGAEYFGTKEKNVNYKILYQVGEKFFNSDPWKLKVYYTRITDVDMTLTNRAYFADKVGADLFVSLHMNASTASSAHGTEVYYAEHNNSPNSAGLTSKTMATLFVNNITKSMGTQNRGAKAERYTVVYKNTVPAVLIELGFLSNQGDYALITDSAFQEQAVQVIYNTLLQIFDKYPTGR
jgi:N-acetylmuramoyl-L-alanine amidase